MRHDGDMWVRRERSGRFWVVVQRKEKRKKVNKVRRLTKCGHNNLRLEIDSAVAHLYDKSAMAEVECYRINKKKLKREYEELRQIQHDIWKRELTISGCACRMAGARIYQRIEVVNRDRLHILMDEYKAHHHGCRS